MGWWLGRKSAPADARPFVPAWLNSDSVEEGFARSYSAQFEEVFRRNPVGQRAVRLVAGMLGGLTIDGEELLVDVAQTSDGQYRTSIVAANGPESPRVWHVVSGSGGLEIGLPTGVSAKLDVHTGSGRVRSDLPIEDAPREAKSKITVRARTGSGDVRLFRAA